jgi:homoserine kinase type II
MAILTPLSDDEIRDAARAFGVDARSARGVLAGSVNTNYEVRGADGLRHFLRVYEEQTPEGAARETRLCAALARLGVPTPEPLLRADGSGRTTLVRGKAAALYPFVEGTIRCQRSVTAEDTRAVGAALGSVHRAGEALDPTEGLTGPSRFDLAAIAQRLDGITGPSVPTEVAAASARLRCEAEALAARPLSGPELPLVHGDLFRDNVLFTPTGGLALLDFESASRGHAAFDVAVTTLAWCFGDALEPPLARALMEGYESVRPLSPAERGGLDRAMRLACVRFATTRITDYELRPRGVGVYKDFRRWMARLDAVCAYRTPG